jgi:hypothetical protein
MREMHSDPEICLWLANINETLAENEEVRGHIARLLVPCELCRTRFRGMDMGA